MKAKPQGLGGKEEGVVRAQTRYGCFSSASTATATSTASASPRAAAPASGATSTTTGHISFRRKIFICLRNLAFNKSTTLSFFLFANTDLKQIFATFDKNDPEQQLAKFAKTILILKICKICKINEPRRPTTNLTNDEHDDCHILV